MRPLWKVKASLTEHHGKCLTCKSFVKLGFWVRKTNRTIQWLIPFAVSLWRAGVEQLYQVKRMIGGIGNMLFPIHFQTEQVYWGQVITQRGQILVSGTVDGTLRVLCCAFVRCAFVRCAFCWCALCVCWRVCWCWCVTLDPSSPSPPTPHPTPLPVCTFKTSPCVPAPRRGRLGSSDVTVTRRPLYRDQTEQNKGIRVL